MGSWDYWRPAAEGVLELGTVSGEAVGLPTHFHREDQLTFVLSGRRRFVVGGEVIVLEAGDGTAADALRNVDHSDRADVRFARANTLLEKRLRQKADFASPYRLFGRSTSASKDFASVFPKNVIIWRLSRAHRGASRSSRTLDAGCGGRHGLQDEQRQGGRRIRVVLTPRRWCQALRDVSQGDGG
jgi:Cupin domain